MGAISNDWLEPLSPEFKKPYYARLYKTVKEEYSTHEIFPPADDIFNAFDFTPLSQVKVVILGQDPYHNNGQAHGLCFSVAQMKRSMLNNPKHLILEAPHPSPLSAYRGFFGCKHFSKANEFLKEHGMEPIDWQIENQ